MKKKEFARRLKEALAGYSEDAGSVAEAGIPGVAGAKTRARARGYLDGFISGMALASAAANVFAETGEFPDDIAASLIFLHGATEAMAHGAPTDGLVR